MFDTIHAYTEIAINQSSHQMIDLSAFSDVRYVMDSSGHETIRAEDNHRHLHIVVRETEHGIRLNIQFSMSAIAHDLLSIYDNLTMDDAADILSYITTLLSSYGLDVDIQSMIVTRIDYTWNYHVSSVAESVGYRRMFAQRTMPGMTRHDYNNGTTFTQQSRAIKLYDKTNERNDDNAHPVLRFEVSNYNPAIHYMCTNWFHCERTIHDLVNAERALYVLSYMHKRFKLNAPESYATHNNIEHKLKSHFGTSYMSASSARRLIAEYDRDVVALGLMSEPNYYAWKRKLSRAGLLYITESSLKTLQSPQNLRKKTLNSANQASKKSGENWGMV